LKPKKLLRLLTNFLTNSQIRTARYRRFSDRLGNFFSRYPALFETGRCSFYYAPVKSKKSHFRFDRSFSVSRPLWFLLLGLENRKSYETAIEFFKQNQDLIKNKNYVAVIDYTKPSFVKRLFIYDVQSATAARYLVAHGKGSGFIYARDFSNEVNSNKSSKGFFITGEMFVGDHGPSLPLHGLQEG